MTDEAEPEGEVPVVVEVPEAIRPGVWANFARVAHSPYEFTLDFARIEFDTLGEEVVTGVAVARVNLSPLLVTQLIDALQVNYQRWAARAMPPEVNQ